MVLGCAGIPMRNERSDEALCMIKITARGKYVGFVSYVSFTGNPMIVSLKNIDSGAVYGSAYEHDGFCFIGPVPKGRYMLAQGTIRSPNNDFEADFSSITNVFAVEASVPYYLGEYSASFGNDGFLLTATLLERLSGRDAGNRVRLRTLLHDDEKEKGWRFKP